MHFLFMTLVSCFCLCATSVLANPKLENTTSMQQRFVSVPVVPVPQHEDTALEECRQRMLDSFFIELPTYKVTYRQMLGDDINIKALTASVSLMNILSTGACRIPLMLAGCLQVSQWVTIAPVLWVGTATLYAAASAKELAFKVWRAQCMDPHLSARKAVQETLRSSKFLASQGFDLTCGALLLYLGAFRS